MRARKFYILKTEKAWVKEWFEEGSWSWENMISVLVRKSNGKIIQIFGSGKNESYGKVGTECMLYSYSSMRFLDNGIIVGYSNKIESNTTIYVFK